MRRGSSFRSSIDGNRIQRAMGSAQGAQPLAAIDDNVIEQPNDAIEVAKIVGPHRPYAIEGPFEPLSTWTEDFLGSKLVCKGT